MAQRMTPSERFWSYVEKTPGCWLWTQRTNPAGYGIFTLGRRKVYAHRFAYEDKVGPIPYGLEVDHLCYTPACVRPSHLEAVIREVNMRRMQVHRMNPTLRAYWEQMQR